MANPERKKFGFGKKLAIVNVFVERAYTRLDLFKTAYGTDPKQIDYFNEISQLAWVATGEGIVREWPARG
ncbi:MAG: hypothetical protein AAGL10_05570 [Pseudomonadota bacterium]